MEGDRVTMSQRERDVLKVMSGVLEGRRTQVEAARLLGLSVRQVLRIRRRLERQGDRGVIHALRGRPSNRRIDAQIRFSALKSYRERYSDFGATFAAEKLLTEGIKVSEDTLRRWLIQEGLWKGRRRRARHRSRRERRECFGELVQADGSIHDWLEGRGEKMTLLVMIDDATSRAVARFYSGETTQGYMDLLDRYMHKYGRMVAMYVDGDSVFAAAKEGSAASEAQFSRALGELEIKLIPAGSPQAKGRVERFNGTAQDRLVKELRLAGATTIAEANRVLEKVFLPWFNRRCTVKPKSPNDAHRRLCPSMNLKAILSVQEKRSVARDYTVRWRNRICQILPPAYPGLCGGKVTVELRRDGTVHLRFKDRYLEYRVVETKADVQGALPPGPRSLSLEGIPAGGKDKGRAAVTARLSAVHPAFGRSGRTPAEPCLPKGKKENSAKERWRPAPDHPWRKKAPTTVT